MTDDAQKDEARYTATREAFSRLDAGEQATFALEALLTAGGTFFQETGRQAANAMRDVERAFDEAFKAKPGPAREPSASAPDVAPDTPSP